MIPYFSQLKLCCCQSLAGTKLGFLELVAFICNYENDDKFVKLVTILTLNRGTGIPC